jgi:hypothetical protein
MNVSSLHKSSHFQKKDEVRLFIVRPTLVATRFSLCIGDSTKRKKHAENGVYELREHGSNTAQDCHIFVTFFEYASNEVMRFAIYRKAEIMPQQSNMESGYDVIADHTFREQSGLKMPSPGQRLTLAIISLFALIVQSVVIIGMLTNGGELSPSWPALILVGILIIAIAGAITAINVVFNIRH